MTTILRGWESVRPFDRSVLSVGNFDGVHRAHRRLIERAKELALAESAPLILVTFDPHPLTVVSPERAPTPLSTLDDRIELLSTLSPDFIVVLRSEPGLLTLDAEAFARQILHDGFHPIHIVEGPSFGFGKGRKGTPQVLGELAAAWGGRVHIVEPVMISPKEGPPVLVSSSLIRGWLTQGDVERAAEGLGRPYLLRGDVIRGDGRGRGIGFPTANLQPSNQVIPGEGVYVGQAWIAADGYACGISIGRAPTFAGSATRIEAHVLDFSGDLYGQPVALEFHRFLRAQRRFDTVEALRAQLHRDIDGVHHSAGSYKAERSAS